MVSSFPCNDGKGLSAMGREILVTTSIGTVFAWRSVAKELLSLTYCSLCFCLLVCVFCCAVLALVWCF